MAHFAKLTENNIVMAVHVVNNSDILKDGIEDEQTGIDYLTKIHGWPLWKKTSYNTTKGKYYNSDGSLHEDQSKAFRKNYAHTGATYDPIRDAFILRKPYESWSLDEESGSWKPPVECPTTETNGVPDLYRWNENTLSFDKEVLYRE